MITRLDYYVGEVLKKLKEKGLDENTLVIFSSDNGPHEEGGADPTFFGRDGKLRGLKRQCYEGGIRIPFIARWPGRVPAGTVNDHICAFYDLMPTFCEIIGEKNYVKKYANKDKEVEAYKSGNLTPEEQTKYEIAQELGILDKVLVGGWKSLSAKETGRIGGIMARKKPKK